MGLLVGNPVRSVKPLRVTHGAGVALDRKQTTALLRAVRDHRLGAAVALLFLQGWRVSEVLGLAWEDVEFEYGPDPENPDERVVVGGRALVHRASV
jgi:integrase